MIMSVLDWKEGYFELTAGVSEPVTPELEVSVTHLLLEHARLQDEGERA